METEHDGILRVVGWRTDPGMDGLQDRSGVGVEASGRSRGGRSRAGRRNYVSDGRPASRALALRARLIYDAHHMSAATAGRTAPSRKEVTHERIVGAAARAIRRSGYDGTGVADIMKKVGLTHGGFYAHFASREAMLAEAADRAGAESVATLTRVAAAAPPQEALRSMMRAYLSKDHVEDAETGCPVAALGSETPRQASRVRRVATRRIKEMIDVVARHSPDQGKPGVYEQALVTVATMVGALVLARAVDDPKLSKALREASLKHLDPTGT